MRRFLRTTRRLRRRLTRPALLLALVLAQAVTAFGFPLARPRSTGATPCDRGDWPLRFAAESPAVPPSSTARPTFAPVPAGTIRCGDTSPTTHPIPPAEPPPRHA